MAGFGATKGKRAFCGCRGQNGCSSNIFYIYCSQVLLWAFHDVVQQCNKTAVSISIKQWKLLLLFPITRSVLILFSNNLLFMPLFQNGRQWRRNWCFRMHWNLRSEQSKVHLFDGRVSEFEDNLRAAAGPSFSLVCHARFINIASISYFPSLYFLFLMGD